MLDPSVGEGCRSHSAERLEQSSGIVSYERLLTALNDFVRDSLPVIVVKADITRLLSKEDGVKDTG